MLVVVMVVMIVMIVMVMVVVVVGGRVAVLLCLGVPQEVWRRESRRFIRRGRLQPALIHLHVHRVDARRARHRAPPAFVASALCLSCLSSRSRARLRP